MTLTYDDEHVPEDGSLRYADFQKFVKRVRKFIAPERLRYFVAGEYGERTSRPHYHACLFGVDWPDKVVFRGNGDGRTVYTSGALDRLWERGFCSTGEVAPASARYVAQYVLKKFNDPVTDGRVPEFCRMSNRRGIGERWFDQWAGDVFPHDFIVVDGVKMKPPRYYDKLLKRRDLVMLEEEVMLSRDRKARERFPDNSDERLLVKERVARAGREFFRKKQL